MRTRSVYVPGADFATHSVPSASSCPWAIMALICPVRVWCDIKRTSRLYEPRFNIPALPPNNARGRLTLTISPLVAYRHANDRHPQQSDWSYLRGGLECIVTSFVDISPDEAGADQHLKCRRQKDGESKVAPYLPTSRTGDGSMIGPSL